MTYRPSDVTVTVKPNPRIINLGEALRMAALVGMGPSTLTVTDETIVHGTGSVDYLATYPGSGIAITQIAKRANLTAGALDYATGSLGSLYAASDYTDGADGSITWASGAIATGIVYYTSYTKPTPAINYTPQIFTDKTSLIATFGPESNTEGILTVGGSIVLENGSPAVMCIQVNSTSFNQMKYQDAIDLLKKKDKIEDLVILFPSGSVTTAQQEAVQAYAFQHVAYCNQITIKKERSLICGSPSEDFATNGFDTIGDSTVTGSYSGRAAVLKSEDVAYVVPSTVTRTNPGGSLMQLDGNFAAAAVAGVRNAQSKRSTPIHGFQVIGIDIPEDKWDETEKLLLGGNNCLVLQKYGGVITIYDALTTDPTSAETTELSIPSVKRLVKRSLRYSIRNTYLNKGLVITDDVLSDIEGTMQSTLLGLIRQGEINDYGKRTNPTTGEIPIRAQKDILEPRRVIATCSIAYGFPLKFVDITVFPFI